MKPGFTKAYARPAVAAPKPKVVQEDKGEGSSTSTKPIVALSPVLDFNTKGAFSSLDIW
jgi:hypothetical protein